MLRNLSLVILVLSTLSCARVTRRVNDQNGSKEYELTSAVLYTELSLYEDGGLYVRDLGAAYHTYDLRVIAEDLRQSNVDSLFYTGNGYGLRVRVLGRSLDIESREKDRTLTLHLPVTVLDLYTRAGDGPVSHREVLSAIRRQKGVLLEVVSKDRDEQYIVH